TQRCGCVAARGARSNPPRMIRRATEDDVARILAIARAAYIKYVPRIGREPPPMLADFAGETAAGHVVVIEVARAVAGYLISWPKMEAYFIDNIAVDPAHQGLGLGRQLMENGGEHGGVRATAVRRSDRGTSPGGRWSPRKFDRDPLGCKRWRTQAARASANKQR